MNPAQIALTRLDSGQRTVIHIEAFVPAIMIVASGIALGHGSETRKGWPAWPPILLTAALALWTPLVAIKRRWAPWSYGRK